MKRSIILLLFLLAGCSTHPVVNVQDHFFPGRIKADPKMQPYGGVCQPQGAIIQGPVIGSPIPPPAPWPPPGAPPGSIPGPPPPPPAPPFPTR